MPEPHLQLFGSPALISAAGRQQFFPQRPFQLLAFLAVRGNWVSRDFVSALFWPDRDTAAARANLRFVLVQVRRLSTIADFEARSEEIRWTVATDVQRFERAVAEARWSTAIDLYSRPLLEDMERGAPPPFVEWLQFERAQLAAAWRDAVFHRLDEIVGDPSAEAALATRVLRADPTDETAMSVVLRSLLSLGRVEEARRTYSEYARRLADELGIEPSADLRDIARQIAPEQATAAPTKAARPSPDRVESELVGRRIELLSLRQALIEKDRHFVTLTGPGGVGKSTLARAALLQLRDAFGGAAHWVALDDLRTLDEVTLRCADVVDVELRGTESPHSQLLRHLQAERRLLVLDNAEHLAGLGAWLERSLAECRELSVLITSRTRLGVSSEWVVPLDGLPVPDADESEPEVLRTYDSVRLFEQRATRLAPDFDAQAEAAEVAAFVRAVDGLPLAIELAAAWVRLLPVAEIRREVSQSLDILDDAQGAGDRSRSMRASLEQSWRLLAPAERGALVCLGVFQGSFSRESALAVGGASLPLLAALADKSLLRAAPGGRFALHPLIQQFSVEKLAQSDAESEPDVRARHAQHFLTILARYQDFHAVDQRSALQSIDAEFENTLAAWRWAAANRRVDLLQPCASALEGFLDSRGQHQFGLELFGLAAKVIDDTLPAHQAARCHVQLARASFCFRLGDFRKGERAARAALNAARLIRYRFGLKSATNTLGLMLWRLGRTKKAAFCLRDVLRRAEADADAGANFYRINLAQIELELGNDEQGEKLLREGLEQGRREDNPTCFQAATIELCRLYLDRGNPAAVIELARDGLDFARSAGFGRNDPYFHTLLAEAHFELNDLAVSAEHAMSALEVIRSRGDGTLESSCRVRLASIALRNGDSTTAWRELQAAAGLVKAMQSPRFQVEVVAAYAHFCRAAGREQESRELADLVLRHAAATRRLKRSLGAMSGLAPDAVGGGETVSGGTPLSLARALDQLLAATP